MIVEFFDICNGAAYKVITKDFKLTNICANFVPKLRKRACWNLYNYLKTLSGNFYKTLSLFLLVKVDKPLENA